MTRFLPKLVAALFIGTISAQAASADATSSIRSLMSSARSPATVRHALRVTPPVHANRAQVMLDAMIGNWSVAAYRDRTAERLVPAPRHLQAHPLRIRTNGNIGFHNACNGTRGHLAIDGGRFSILNMMTTLRYCGTAAGAMDLQLGTALSASHYAVSGPGWMMMYDDYGTQMLDLRLISR